MRLRSRSLVRYGFAVGTVTAALLFKLLLDQVVDQERTPLLFFFAAVIGSTWYGGLGPGVTAAILAAVAIDVFFLAPQESFVGQAAERFLQLALFVFEAILVSAFMKTRDVIHRERAERLLRQSDTRFRAIAESATDPIVSADVEGRICYWNRRAEQVFGYAAREVMAKPLAIIMPERYQAPHSAAIERMRLTGESRLIGQTVELHGLTKSGVEFPIELSLSTWKWGKETFYTGIIRDITRRKEAEESRAQFASNLSHEMNTGLTEICLLSETLLLGRIDSSEERRRSLEVINGEARRLARVVDNLLKLSRVERAAFVPAVEPTDLAELIRETLDQFVSFVRIRRFRLRTELEEDLVVSVDTGAVREILLNLLDNAVKYGPAEQTITVGLEAMDGHARIWVADEGSGIRLEDRERIWKRFSRLERHHASGVAGTGIGLALVRELTRLHGGDCWVEDAPDGGARFVVELPGVQRIRNAAEEQGTARALGDASRDGWRDTASFGVNNTIDAKGEATS